MGIFQAALIGLVALIITPGYFFYFDVTPKVAVVLLGTAAALIWSAFTQGGGGAKLRLFGILVAFEVLSLALSTALSGRPALSLIGTNWRRYGALLQSTALIFAWLVAWHTAGQPHRIRAILRAVAATGAAASLFGIAQYFGWDPFLPAAAYHVGEGVWTIVRPPGTLGYVSYFATWLLFTVFLSLTLARMEKDLAWRRVAYAAAVLALTAMQLTGTRAAILGLAVGACVWLFWTGFRIPRSWLLAAAGVCVALAGFYLSPAGQPLRSRMRWFVEDPWGGARPHLWRDSLAMFLHRPAAGYGPETFTAEFPRFESLELARAYPDFVHESPHNILLDAAVAQGLPGLILLCCLLALGFRTANPGLAAALAAGIVAQQFTVFTLPTALITFTTVALAISESHTRLRVSKLAFLPATLLLYAAIRLMVSGHALALAQKSLAAADEASAATHYAQYQRWRLPGASADLWYSRASVDFAASTRDPAARFQGLIQAGAAGVRATGNSEDPVDAWYSLALFYAAQNDPIDTGRCLRAAIAANRNWFKPHWTLAQMLRLQGRLQEAEQEAEWAVRCDGGKNPEVSQTLAEIRAQRVSKNQQP